MVFLILVATLKPGDGAAIGFQLDKLIHFSLFFLLGINLCYKFQAALTTWLLWAILFGFFTEIAQQFIPGRGMDLFDGLADTLGIVLAYHFYKGNQVWVDSVFQKIGA